MKKRPQRSNCHFFRPPVVFPFPPSPLHCDLGRGAKATGADEEAPTLEDPLAIDVGSLKQDEGTAMICTLFPLPCVCL